VIHRTSGTNRNRIIQNILAIGERRNFMDPRFVQWQNFRPTKRNGQPWNETAPNGQRELVRPVQQPSQSKSNQQQTQRRGGCCGRRATE
jgi:hypothetical protein